MTFPADYTALLAGAALGAPAARGQIGVAGKDRAAYLQGLLTNDVVALTAGTGCYAAWLTPQGRLLTDLHVLESGDMMLLDVPADQADSTLQRLDQFLFSEDVQLADLRPSLRGVWIHGPRAAATIERTLTGVPDVAAWPEYHNVRATFAAAPVVAARIDQLGVPGFCIYIDPAQAAALEQALESHGALRAGVEAVDALRIEAGTPLFGRDMDEDIIPLEAGIEERAISFSKGCYVGQEVIIRVLHRGHGRVAKKLVRLEIEGEDLALAGAEVREGGGARVIGRITSSARSPRRGPIALAYVHRDYLATGTKVDVDTPAGRSTATVS